MTCKSDIPLHGPAVNFVRQNRGALCDVISSKFDCVAFIDGVDFDNEPNLQLQRKFTSEDQPRFAVVLRSGVQVSVWKADLTSFPVDAVVNAANTRLQHHGGLAYALVEAGGPEIQKESDDYIRKYGELMTGEAVIGGSGFLPCNRIIHAVGPRLPSYPSTFEVSNAERLLKTTVRSILDKVKDLKLQTVAIPAISSGIFNYPLPECANTIVSTVKDYYEYSSRGHRPKEVFLVNHDDPTVHEMTRACHHILADKSSKSFSQAAASKGRADAKTSTNSLQMERVLLKLKKGNIEEEKTNVIVNTASQDRNLNVGEISKALLKKAGHGLQKEIRSAPPQNGHVIITKAYDLHSNLVFHTFCTWRSNANAQKILFDSVKECLWLAVTNKQKSIAFPAIGTGSLGFDKKEVAKIITTAVAEFAKSTPAVLEVNIVIFPSDEGTFKAFEEEMRNLKRGVPQPGFEIASNSGEDFSGTKAPSPQITLSGASDEVTREAEQWLQNLLSETYSTSCIQNNFIVHFGKQEYQELSHLNVSIEECFENGRASITIKGNSYEDVAVARLQVEAILCKVQKEFVRDQEREIFRPLLKNVSFERKTLHQSDPESLNRVSFKNQWIRKVEKVQNPVLEMLFELKKQQLKCTTTHTMFQCLPAQFLNTVSRVGFHAELAPPEDPVLGEGIYFARTVDRAMKMWKGQNEGSIYFVEAEVLLGNSTDGKKDLILPPLTSDPQTRYDSVTSGRDVAAIFSGYQALPKFIITCNQQK